MVEALKVFFNIQQKDLDVKCDKYSNDRMRMSNVYEMFKELHDKKPPTEPGYEYTHPRNVIASALPCASAKEWDDKLNYYKSL